MKKQLFGYNTSETKVIINALREENESLNATIATLKTQIKNNVGEKNAKYILLDEKIKAQENELLNLSAINQELINKNEALVKKNRDLSMRMNNLHKMLKDITRDFAMVEAEPDFNFAVEAAATLEESTDTPAYILDGTEHKSP